MSTPKKDGYARRNAAGIPAPMDYDSDPEFAPGAYVYEEKKKRGRRSTAASTDLARKRQRVGGTLAASGASGSKKARRHVNVDANPLRKYFENLDLHSESEKDEDDAAADSSNDNFSNSDVEMEDDAIDLSQLQTWKNIRPQSQDHPGNPASKRTSPQGGNGPVAEDSVTESETEPESDDPRLAPNRVQSNSTSNRSTQPQKSTFPTPVATGGSSGDEDSVTEPETDDDPFSPPKPKLPPPKKAQKPQLEALEDQDSVTESESEDETRLDPRLRPRPGFALRPGQEHPGPLVLDDEQDIKVPAAINTYLRDYQRDGVKFLWDQYNKGMGKTIQVISFLSAIMKKNGVITDKHRRRKYVSKLQDGKAWKESRQVPRANLKWPTCLIIAPSTVVHNWAREFQTWGYFEVGLYFGEQKERQNVLHDFKLGRLDVVVTTFDLARRDIDLLDNLPWSCIIVDEVHRVKNKSAKITVAYNQFECQRRFGLTGTAIQNSYKELWTILDWTNPGRLGTEAQWAGYVTKPLTISQSVGATEEERAQGVIVARILRDKLLPNFFLRRTKDIIKDQLPKKIDQVVFCPLTPNQISAYKNLLGMEALQNMLKKDDPCDCGSRKKRKACCHPFVVGDLFRYMSILIKLSNHLGLILPGGSDSAEQNARNRELAPIVFPDGRIPKYGTAMLQPQYCGKWGALEVLLKEWRKNKTNKVLLFTKSVKLLDMLEFHLNTKGYHFLKLDGSTKQSDRMPMIDKFHDDPDIFIFLISTLAGGTGLNLTAANKVVIFDPNWNPAHDLQAMDRAFRFGQTRDVSVYRLLGAGSIEELIYARQIYKQQQMAIGYEASVQTRYFEGVQGDNQKTGELFGLKNIFKFHEGNLATKMAIERANLAELDWALTHLDASKAKKHKRDIDELVQADAKPGREDADLKGLGALLFDDAPLPAEVTEESVIQKTLNAIGVKYSHRNDDVLIPSRIEEERTKQSLKKTIQKKKARQSGGGGGGGRKSKAAAAAPPAPQWPPVRKHHKTQPKLTPEQTLSSRHRALIHLGYVSCPADVPKFAQDFARKPEEEQIKIVAQLDEWSRSNPVDSDSD